MPKIIDYPRRSYEQCIQLAKAVDFLGGSCSTESAADKMGYAVSGGFRALVGAANKFNLVESKSGDLRLTELYKVIKLAYDETEKSQNEIKAFLSPAMFYQIYERFKGRELPVEMLERLMIREFKVENNISSRVKKYFIDGAMQVGLLDGQNRLIDFEKNNSIVNERKEQEQHIQEEEPESDDRKVIKRANETGNDPTGMINIEEFIFHIIGPGINSKIEIREEEDFLILEAMIRKVKKKFDF